MKNILITLLSMLIPGSAIMAQYQNVQEKAPLVNVPLALFNGITTKRMHQGRMQIILRSNWETGEVKQGVTSNNLKRTLRLKTAMN